MENARLIEYDFIGGVTENDVNEFIDFVKDLKDEVDRWLEREHPELTQKRWYEERFTCPATFISDSILGRVRLRHERIFGLRHATGGKPNDVEL